MGSERHTHTDGQIKANREILRAESVKEMETDTEIERDAEGMERRKE